LNQVGSTMLCGTCFSFALFLSRTLGCGILLPAHLTGGGCCSPGPRISYPLSLFLYFISCHTSPTSFAPHAC
jgi:hypothetical protein